MKRFIRGAIIVLVIWIVLVVINVIANVNGYELDSVATGTVAATGAVFIESALNRKQKEQDAQK